MMKNNNKNNKNKDDKEKNTTNGRCVIHKARALLPKETLLERLVERTTLVQKAFHGRLGVHAFCTSSPLVHQTTPTHTHTHTVVQKQIEHAQKTRNKKKQTVKENALVSKKQQKRTPRRGIEPRSAM